MVLSNSGITVLSFANKVVKVQPQSSFVLCTEYQGRYNIDILENITGSCGTIFKNLRRNFD